MKKGITEFYKNKYIIGIYAQDEYETLVAVLDNAHEFAEYFNISIENARVTLGHWFSNINKTYYTKDGKELEIHFISIK